MSDESTPPPSTTLRATTAAMFLISFALILFELVMTRLFGVVIFANFAHLALALAMLGIGIGAIMQHMRPSFVPDEGLENRLATLAILQGASTFVAVVAVLQMPLTTQFQEAPSGYGERSSVAMNLVDPFWFAMLLPVLTIPFIIAGLSFAGVFHRRKQYIGRLYGADLIGGAIGALVFVPLLTFLPGPDTVFVILGVTLAAAAYLWRSTGRTNAAKAAAGAAVICGLVSSVTLTGTEILKVQYSAGYSEENISHVKWTPITRLAVHDGKRGTHLLLDNSSASQVIRTEKERKKISKEIIRSLVYQFHTPPARVAILAASAGPEVAVAQARGFENIHAIDIARTGDLVAEQFPDAPVNPYVIGNTQRLHYDGRAAIIHANAPFDIIQMVHANLHSSAGLMSNAWSPSLLETKEAFVTYLENLSDDGTLSFGRGQRTRGLYLSATRALEALGVDNPERNIVYITGPGTMMLVKKRPWTEKEMTRLTKLVGKYRKQKITINPLNPNMKKVQHNLKRYPLLTDNRPYFDSPSTIRKTLRKAFERYTGRADSKEDVPAPHVIYHTLMIQIFFVLLAGLGFLVLPFIKREAAGLAKTTGVGFGLGFVACLGYGYLGVETVLIHELVLFVGHPVYAITVVVLTMLMASGLGSFYVQQLAPERLNKTLHMALGIIVVLGALQAWVIPGLLHAAFLGQPIALRLALTALCLTPIGFVMGMPFPLSMRILRPSASGMVPWAWALNGWMSVVASLGTVLVSRLYGYSQAFGVALVAYILATLLAHRISAIGAISDASSGDSEVAC